MQRRENMTIRTVLRNFDKNFTIKNAYRSFFSPTIAMDKR